MGLVSVSAYAATHGATKQAAAKWKSRGALVMSGALVDVAASDAKMRAAGLGRFKARPTGAAKRQPKVTSVDAPVVDPVVVGAGEDVDDEALDRFAENLLQGRFASVVLASQVKENALALKHLVAARKGAGAVVETAVAEAVLFEVTRNARNAWLNWPSQIAPLLASDLGLEAEKVLEALTPYVHEHLEQLGEPHADFRASGEE